MEETQINHYYACLTFVAKRSYDLCGSNGLPLTPCSINILGRAQYLKTLKHPNLFPYIDFLRGKHGRTVIVSEQYGNPLNGFIFKNWLEVIHFAKNVLQALAYLHKNGIIHQCISKKNIFFCNNGWKLFNYGNFYMTGNGVDVFFPICEPKYCSPEVVLQGPNKQSSGKSDVWSLGIILVEILLGIDLWADENFYSCLKKSLSFIFVKNVFFHIAKKYNKCHLYQKLPQDVVNFVCKMLVIDPSGRLSARELLQEEILTLIDYEKKFILRDDLNKHSSLDRNSSLELYHYWQLTGGDVYMELKKEGLIRTSPPILTIPKLILLEGTCYGQKADEEKTFDGQIVFFTIDGLVLRLKKLPYIFRYPDLKKRDCLFEMSSLPVSIKESDTDYQFKRIQLFKEIFKLLPDKFDVFINAAHQDIPPFLRAKIWSLILQVEDDYISRYKSIDKEKPMRTDRQIEVDIPRCHQYNELLSSSSGHGKFKRILKAWVKSHPEYVYWQGLDSLCAPFLYLNFYNEARAYACLTNFIDKYLNNFFLRDNSSVIKEYLAKFKHLIAFLDPVLANHLHSIGFSPELFAIPWFLTMFSHVFPIQKILNLWDSLLLGNASYPLYIGFSVLKQLRSILLESGFNECILLFSDLPEIDIEHCVKSSLSFYRSSPRSITYRKHEIVDRDDQRLVANMYSDLTLEELMNEWSPRICSEELRQIISNPLQRAKVLLVDIRHPSLFLEYNFSGSINLHGTELKPEKHIDNPKSELNVLYNNKGKLITVIGDNDLEVAKFCRFLVECGLPKVCSLHGGLKALYRNEKKCS